MKYTNTIKLFNVKILSKLYLKNTFNKYRNKTSSAHGAYGERVN
jgi:hypothetical protein